jgi:hypothetical protein
MKSPADQHEVRPADAVFCRNLGLLAFGGATYVGFDLVATSWHFSFAEGLHVSLGVTLALAGAYLLWGSRFIVRNVGRGTAFFRANDDRFRGLTNTLFFAVGPLMMAAGVVLYLQGTRFPSGVLVVPGSLLSFFGLARATGGVGRL